MNLRILAGALALTMSVSALAVNTSFTYQGVLKQAGQPVDGFANLYFQLFDAPTGGVPVSFQIETVVPVDEGRFTIELDFGIDAVATSQQLWLQVSAADGQNLVPLTPRQKLTSSLFSLNTRGIDVDASGVVQLSNRLDVNSAGDSPLQLSSSGSGFGSSQIRFSTSGLWGPMLLLQSQAAGGDEFRLRSHGEGQGVPGSFSIYSANDNQNRMLIAPNGDVAFGGGQPDSKLHVFGGTTMDASFTNGPILHGIAPGTNFRETEVKLETLGGQYGMTLTMIHGGPDGRQWEITSNGEANRGGPGALTINDVDSNRTRLALLANGKAGVNRSSATHSLDVFEHTTDPLLARFEGSSDIGAWLNLFTRSPGGRYWRLISTGANNGEGAGKLVIGTGGAPNANETVMTMTPARDVGVGETNPQARLHAFASAADGVAVLGEANNGNAPVGVRGTSSSSFGTGVEGQAVGFGIGVVGRNNDANGFAVFSNGNFASSGTKSFVIDHPSDPANRYLVHYSAESSEPLNVYSGTVTLDANGAAVVVLPAFVQKVTRDFRYQLTAIGAAMPNLHVAEKVRDGRFAIAGGVANKQVSWEVKGVRDDAWVRTFGHAAEPMKPEAVRGTYLNPSLHGAPPEAAQFPAKSLDDEQAPTSN